MENLFIKNRYKKRDGKYFEILVYAKINKIKTQIPFDIIIPCWIIYFMFFIGFNILKKRRKE